MSEEIQNDTISEIMGDQAVITAARLDHRKGQGLGYLIIKDLIKMIGAEIIISSEKGKAMPITILEAGTPGTTVSIKISE